MMKKNNRRGQSLLEMIIAISMLTVAFLGIAALLSKSFFLNRVATNQTIATYLAAEGIEITKNIIDHDVYNSGLRWSLLKSGNYSADVVDFEKKGLEAYKPNTPLNFDSSTGLYQYETGSPTNFYREIKIATPSAYEIDVTSIVTWSSGSLTNENVALEDHFYDWHP